MWEQNLQEALFVYILKQEIGYDIGYGSFLFRCAIVISVQKTDTGDKVKNNRIPNNTGTQQENTKANT